MEDYLKPIRRVEQINQSWESRRESAVVSLLLAQWS